MYDYTCEKNLTHGYVILFVVAADFRYSFALTAFEVASRELPWGDKMADHQIMFAVCLQNERPSMSRLHVSLYHFLKKWLKTAIVYIPVVMLLPNYYY